MTTPVNLDRGLQSSRLIVLMDYGCDVTERPRTALGLLVNLMLPYQAVSARPLTVVFVRVSARSPGRDYQG